MRVVTTGERVKLYCDSMRRNGVVQFVLAACMAGLAACDDPAEPPVDEPSAFISMKRAWLPGERQATIDAIVAGGGFGPYSDLAPVIYADPDSVVVIVANPDFSVRAAGQNLLVLEPRFDASWNISGMDIRLIDDTQAPSDTTDWTGVFWSNPTEATWNGFVFAATATNTFAPVAVSTTAFDASFGKSGAGGGENRQSTGAYWEANGPTSPAINTIQMNAVTFTGTPTTVTSGPYSGGTQRNGTFQGRLKRVEMTRVLGTDLPATFEVDLDFRTTAIQGVELICQFPSPCFVTP